MDEELEIFDLKGRSIGYKNRKDFYNEIKEEFIKNNKITMKVKTIRLLLMNSKGRIYLQKRSKEKEENANLYDKTIGGHVSKGDTFNITVIRECAEELGFPAAVLPEKEFEKAIKVTDLSIIGLFKKVETISNFESVRISRNGDKFIQPTISKMYVGYYDGAIRFVDGESSGIEVFSLKDLEKEIKKNPEKFTQDLIFMIKRYAELLKPIDKLGIR